MELDYRIMPRVMNAKPEGKKYWFYIIINSSSLHTTPKTSYSKIARKRNIPNESLYARFFIIRKMKMKDEDCMGKDEVRR